MPSNEMVILSEVVFLFLTLDIALRQEYGGEDTEDFIMCSLVFEPQRMVHLFKIYIYIYFRRVIGSLYVLGEGVGPGFTQRVEGSGEKGSH